MTQAASQPRTTAFTPGSELRLCSTAAMVMAAITGNAHPGTEAGQAQYH